jgi:hypothetical protein
LFVRTTFEQINAPALDSSITVTVLPRVDECKIKKMYFADQGGKTKKSTIGPPFCFFDLKKNKERVHKVFTQKSSTTND